MLGSEIAVVKTIVFFLSAHIRPICANKAKLRQTPHYSYFFIKYSFSLSLHILPSLSHLFLSVPRTAQYFPFSFFPLQWEPVLLQREGWSKDGE